MHGTTGCGSGPLVDRSSGVRRGEAKADRRVATATRWIRWAWSTDSASMCFSVPWEVPSLPEEIGEVNVGERRSGRTSSYHGPPCGCCALVAAGIVPVASGWSAPGRHPTAVDSAGVEIVTSTAPAWGETAGLGRRDPTRGTIGSLDGEQPVPARRRGRRDAHARWENRPSERRRRVCGRTNWVWSTLRSTRCGETGNGAEWTPSPDKEG